MLRFSISASADNAQNMASNVPSSRHLANRAYTDCQGPYVSGSSRHCAPLRAIQSIPFSILRSSFRGRLRFPALSGGNSSFMRSHCPFLNSYRFISLLLHERSFCAIFIFQTRPRIVDIPNYYDTSIFNECEQMNYLMETLDIWGDIHPSLITLPMEWEYEMPYGIVYTKKPSKSVAAFIEVIRNSIDEK